MQATVSDEDIKTINEMNVLSRGWKWTLALGVIYTALGMLAFLLPVASTIGVTITIATLLLVGGVMRLIHAFRHRKMRGSAIRFLQAAVALVSGALMLRYIDAGMVAISIALS